MNWRFVCCFIGLFSCFTAFGQKKSLEKLRIEYLKALHDYEAAPKVYDSILKIENPTAKELAYKGALEAIMTKTSWNIFKKIRYLNKSEDSFDQAVALDPKDLEIRLMRMAVQYEIPSYLGYSDDIETDKAFILKNIDEFDPKDYSENILKEIIGFIYKCNKFTTAQIKNIQSIIFIN